MDKEIHEYRGDRIDVTWDQKRCIHAAECVHGLPAVFNTDNRPWVDPDQADTDAVADVVLRCPTGALHFERHDGGPAEAAPDRNVVTVAADGPLYLRGDVTLETEGGQTLSDTRLALCRCGASENKPLCDGSHAEAGFEAAGTVAAGDAEPSAESDQTELTITATADGPLLFDGQFDIRNEDGSANQTKSDAALCRCGASENKPFCDGAHASVGFVSEDAE